MHDNPTVLPGGHRRGMNCSMWLLKLIMPIHEVPPIQQISRRIGNRPATAAHSVWLASECKDRIY